VQQQGPVDDDQPHDVQPNGDDNIEADDDEVESEKDTEQEDNDDQQPPLQYADNDGAHEHDGEPVDAHTAPTELPDSFSFNITSTDFKCFVGSGKSCGLIGGWTAFMHEQFHAVYPSCALAFHYNHCHQRHSQKSNTPYWVGRARCRTSNCIEVCLYIQDEPATDKDARVDVEVTGVCQHVADGDEVVVERPNRRQIRANQRAESTDLMTSSQQSATELHYRRLGEMSEMGCFGSNTTTCQTIAVLRQAAYEKRQSQHLHEHLIMELDIARECWEASTPDVQYI